MGDEPALSAGNQADSLAVVSVLIKEDKLSKDPNSVNKLRKAALALAEPFHGLDDPTVELKIVLDQFIPSVM